MLDLQLESTFFFKKIIDSIKDLINDAPFNCSENGVELEAIDSSHVALISLKLSPTFFKQYRCDRAYQIGLNMKSLNATFHPSTTDDECTIRVIDTDQNSVKFLFNDPGRTKVRKVKLTRTTVSFDPLTISDLPQYDAIITMCSSEFSKLMKDLAQFTDTVTITVIKYAVTFYGKSDIEEIEVIYNGVVGNEFKLIFEMNQNVTSKFSVKHLIKFVKAAEISNRVRLYISEGHPMIVEYKMNDDAGILRFFLSARVDDDEDME